jgi:hypothetical protein
MVYPSYHPKAGKPTLFIEKIYASLADTIPGFNIPNDANKFWDWHEYYNCTLPKHHTIRAGHRFKEGDKFSPRIWSGVPYRSNQITFAPDIEVTNTWDFELIKFGAYNDVLMTINGQPPKTNLLNKVFQNDGLSHSDFSEWFCSSPDFLKTGFFDGQIICWNKNINY